MQRVSNRAGLGIIGLILVVTIWALIHSTSPRSAEPASAAVRHVASPTTPTIGQSRERARPSSTRPEEERSLLVPPARVVDATTGEPLATAAVLLTRADGSTQEATTGLDGDLSGALTGTFVVDSHDAPKKFVATRAVLTQTQRTIAVDLVAHLAFSVDRSEARNSQERINIACLIGAEAGQRALSCVSKRESARATAQATSTATRIRATITPDAGQYSMVVPANQELRVVIDHPDLYAVRPTHELVYGAQRGRRFSVGRTEYPYPCPVSAAITLPPGGEETVSIEFCKRCRIEIASGNFIQSTLDVQLARLHQQGVDEVVDHWRIVRAWGRRGRGKHGETLTYDSVAPGRYRVLAQGQTKRGTRVSAIEFDVGATDKQVALEDGVGPFSLTMWVTDPKFLGSRWRIRVDPTTETRYPHFFRGTIRKAIPMVFSGLRRPQFDLRVSQGRRDLEFAIDLRRATDCRVPN